MVNIEKLESGKPEATWAALVPAWKQAAAITKRGPDMNKIKHLRQTSSSVLFTATGLNIIGCIGYDIFDACP